MNVQGLTMRDWKSFKDLVIKANNEQLRRIQIEVNKEQVARLERIL